MKDRAIKWKRLTQKLSSKVFIFTVPKVTEWRENNIYNIYTDNEENNNTNNNTKQKINKGGEGELERCQIK